MPGAAAKEKESWEHMHRWRPVNSLKNSRITIQVHCSWSNKRFNVPEHPIQSSGNLVNYFDEASDDEHILGSTTLSDLIKRVKKHIPGLYLWDEVGGAVLTCGPHEVFQSEWDTTMVCVLVGEDKAKKATMPMVVLEDGREAYVVTRGTPESVKQAKPTVVTRCLAKGDVYG